MRSISVTGLRPLLAHGVCLIDVREPVEFAAGHVPGARLIPLSTVPAALAEFPSDEPVYVICEVGARSAHAASFLSQRGIDARNVDGGTQAWVAAGYPVER